MKELTSKERVYRTLRREPVDRVPLFYRMKHEAKQKLARVYGIDRFLQPLRQVIDEGNVAMNWLKLFKEGATIPAIMERSVTDMYDTELLYLEDAPTCEPASCDHQVPFT